MRLRFLLLALIPAALIFAPKASANRPVDREPAQAVMPVEQGLPDFWAGIDIGWWGSPTPTPTPSSRCDQCKAKAKATYDSKMKDCGYEPEGQARIICQNGAARIYESDLTQCISDGECAG
jgi:hypothetical protein